MAEIFLVRLSPTMDADFDGEGLRPAVKASLETWKPRREPFNAVVVKFLAFVVVMQAAGHVKCLKHRWLRVEVGM